MEHLGTQYEVEEWITSLLGESRYRAIWDGKRLSEATAREIYDALRAQGRRVRIVKVQRVVVAATEWEPA